MTGRGRHARRRVLVAFARASNAVAAAADAQSVLADGPVRVRVHCAARIAAAGRGGQVLLSQADELGADRVLTGDESWTRISERVTPVH
jgi:hypothetical protein